MGKEDVPHALAEILREYILIALVFCLFLTKEVRKTIFSTWGPPSKLIPFPLYLYNNDSNTNLSYRKCCQSLA